MNQNRTVPPIYAWGYLLGLLMTYMAAGWVLAAYAAPLLMWVWTVLLIAYVAWADTGAIAVAMLWVVSVVWIAAYTTATPILMNWKGPTWAISLVGVWLFAIGVILMLAFAQTPIQALGWSRQKRFYRLLIITGIGLTLGRLFYQGAMPLPQSALLNLQ